MKFEKKLINLGGNLTEIDGIVFDSKLEAHVYLRLKVLEKEKKIRNLKTQDPVFDLIGATKPLQMKYTCDFSFFDVERNEQINLEVKSILYFEKTDFKIVMKILASMNVKIDIFIAMSSKMKYYHNNFDILNRKQKQTIKQNMTEYKYFENLSL